MIMVAFGILGLLLLGPFGMIAGVIIGAVLTMQDAPGAPAAARAQ